MLRQVTRRAALIFTVGALALFWLLPLTIPVSTLRLGFSAMAFGCLVVVAVIWARPMWRELRGHSDDPNSGAWVIVLGIYYWTLTLAWQRLYAMILVYMHEPAWIRNSWVAAFVPYSIMLGAVLFLMAPTMTDDVPKPNRKVILYLIIAVLIGAATIGLMDVVDLPI